jgi:Flp pilus assembly protein TadD
MKPGTLFPVLGFMDAYFMRFSFVCDHWVYLSSLGLIALSASVIVQILERLQRPTVLWGLVVVLLPVLGILTWRQSRMYADMETLWQTTLRLNPDCWMAHANLGSTLLHKGELNGAITHCQRALEIKPDNLEARNNLAIALAQKGSLDEATAHFQKVLEIKPDYAEGHNNLGSILLQKGNLDEAITHFQNALSSRDIEPTIRGRVESNLGNALLSKGQIEQAISHYQAAIEIAPDNAFNLNNLAWVRAVNPEARFRDGPAAVQLAERACQLTDYKEPQLIGTLAAAYAEVGRFEEAVVAAEKARDLALILGQKGQVEMNEGMIQLFRTRQPYRELAQQSK